MEYRNTLIITSAITETVAAIPKTNAGSTRISRHKYG